MTNASGNNKILWVLIVMVVLLTVVSGANLYLMLGSGKTGDSEPAAEDTAVEATAPIFVKIGPLTVNLDSEAYGQRLLYTTLSLRVGNEQTREFLTTHMPEVHSRLLLLLSAQQAEELATTSGKQRLSEQVMAQLQQPFTEPQPALDIGAVLFSDFILQ